ncbi:hypothetical protein ASG36_15700 [Geodermatophilus sp. Leaf369]|nr:hypothetical protein ASG36_15700 [Geodermatophilus sp. Leaf369]
MSCVSAHRRAAPEVATPRVMARVTGGLYLAGALAVLVLGSAAWPRPGAGVLLAVAATAAVTGAVVSWSGRRLPRWAYHGLVAAGTALITVTVVASPGPATAVAGAAIGAFVALDAFFFFGWPGAVAQLGWLVTTLTVALASRPTVPVSAVVVVDLVLLAVAVVVGGLVQRASSAGRDPLTGLANRRGFDEAATDLVRGCRRSGLPLSAALLDLDHFKAVNDRSGHSAGDDLLQSVASRWRPALPAGAVLARHGGDEFALLLPDATGPVALAVVEQLRYAVPGVGLSCGVTQWRPGETVAQLMRRADGALYQAKNTGRGRSVLDDQGPDPLVAELTAALAAGPGESGLEVHYQGIVAVGSGQLVGVEALARWEHPTLGAQSPARFVPLAEDHGLIDVLGRRVLDQACRDLAELHRQTGQRLLLTVNVSGHQLCDPDFPGDVRSALTAAGWPAASLVLEVTESLVEADSAAAVAALTALRDTGVSVAIDDFGTGFSSLARLDTLPADYLKLDDSFTAALTTSTRRARLMRSIVGMAEALDLQVIAEGVETPEQAERLRALGCRYAQGFLFHRPSPVAGLRELLRERAQTSTGPPLRQ